MKRWITRIAVLAALVGTSALVVPAMATPAAAHDSWGYSNGCSVPGNPPWRDSPSGVNFHNACDSHDLCYVFHSAGSSEAGRKACDDMFYRLMQQRLLRSGSVVELDQADFVSDLGRRLLHRGPSRR